MPELSFRISSYAECAQDLLEFRNRNRDTQRDRRYTDWRYLGRPCAVSPVILWADRGTEPVGALTVFPHDYFVGDGEYPLGVLGDISVLDRERGRGIAPAMLRALPHLEAMRQLQGGLVIPTDTAARSLLKAGWRDIVRIERYGGVLDVTPRLERWLGKGQAARVVATPMNGLIRRLRKWIVGGRARSYRGFLLEKLDDRFDELWRRIDKSGKFLGVRNQRYLRWRFQDHPLNRYRTLAIGRDDELYGYAMYRFAGAVCHVDDVFYDPGRCEAAGVLGLLLGHLSEQGVATISISVTPGSLDLSWWRLGFRRRPDFMRVMIADLASNGDCWSKVQAGAWTMTGADKDI